MERVIIGPNETPAEIASAMAYGWSIRSSDQF